uniref:phosphatase PAP2 family protein n=1 Tax=Flavobacterium sp. TaxID=239 RepID=UPI00404B4B51
MLEKIISLDKELLIYLNNLGNPTFDGFWLFITKQINWIPLFLLVFYLIFKKINWKQLLLLVLFLAVLIAFVDQITNLFKFTFERKRPCSDLSINDSLRILIERSSFSFFSGHASNSMATAVFIFCVMKPFYKYSYLVFIFPLIFAYSRIYLALHFPTDILSGYLFGAISGFTFFKIYSYFKNKPSFQVN